MRKPGHESWFQTLGTRISLSTRSDSAGSVAFSESLDIEGGPSPLPRSSRSLGEAGLETPRRP